MRSGSEPGKLVEFLRGRGAIHFRQDHQARGAFHQRTDGGAIVGAHDEIALPVTIDQVMAEAEALQPTPRGAEVIVYL